MIALSTILSASSVELRSTSLACKVMESCLIRARGLIIAHSQRYVSPLRRLDRILSALASAVAVESTLFCTIFQILKISAGKLSTIALIVGQSGRNAIAAAAVNH